MAPARAMPPGRDRESPYTGAAVAIGSTSVHFTAAAVAGGALSVVADESVLLELGRTVDLAGHLPAQRRAELLGSLRRYGAAAEAAGAADLTFVATEPLRRASDAASVQEEVRAATGRTLHVVTHEEEAFLSLLGTTQGRRLRDDLLVVDIGGGSSEYVLAGRDARPEAAGLPIGAARLTLEVVSHDPPTAAEIAELRRRAGQHLAAADVRSPGQIVFLGGTAANLAKVVPSATADLRLTPRRLASAFRTLGRAPADETAARFAISPVRASILPAGAALVEAFLRRSGLAEGSVSESSIREGTILAVWRAGDAWRAGLPELTAGWWP